MVQSKAEVEAGVEIRWERYVVEATCRGEGVGRNPSVVYASLHWVLLFHIFQGSRKAEGTETSIHALTETLLPDAKDGQC